MNTAGQTVCLCMIVKNESRVIERCLASVRPIIDAWAIVDTGSTDGTQDIVRGALADLPGELVERPWVDFGHNRSEALVLARGRADYVLVIDADEVLETDDGFELPKLVADVYTAEVSYSGCTYLRRQLLADALPWRYEGVLHEYVTCEEAHHEEFLARMRTIVHTDGARSGDPHKFRRDAIVLEQAVLDEPDNSRYAFYLAQSYRDCGDVELALRWYRKRVAMGGWPEEVWFSLYQIAALQEQAGTPWPEVLDAYLRAYARDPSRAEPLYRVALHHQACGEPQLAMLYLDPAAALPLPPPSALFVERPLYEIHIPLEHAVAAFYMGDHERAIATNNALLRAPVLPAELVDHVISNRRFSLDASHPPATGAEPARLEVVVVFADPGPGFDDTVESLLRQDVTDARITFIDDASAGDHRSRVPLEDRRVSLVRLDAPVGFEAAVREFARAVDGVVVALGPDTRLAEPTALAAVAEAFGDPAVALAYGQFRRDDGALGDAEPPTGPADHAGRGPAMAGASPLLFRSELAAGTAEHSPLADSLWRAAGFEGTRFVDQVLTVAQRSQPPRPSPPALTGAARPKVSCLMVTYDRLTLAKRAMRSFAEQTWTDRELVIVTAGSGRFVDALQSEASALGIAAIFVRAAPTTSLGALRNLSLDAADGEIVCQWDDDDFHHPRRIEAQRATCSTRAPAPVC